MSIPLTIRHVRTLLSELRGCDRLTIYTTFNGADSTYDRTSSIEIHQILVLLSEKLVAPLERSGTTCERRLFAKWRSLTICIHSLEPLTPSLPYIVQSDLRSVCVTTDILLLLAWSLPTPQSCLLQAFDAVVQGAQT